MTRGERALLAGIVAAGAAIRFAGIGVQSWSPDEGVTVALMKLSFGDLFTAIRHSESTPPLYYVVAWVWAKVFGLNEAGLRSFSALAGSLTVPVAYLAGASLVTRRAGLVVAALAAFNPLLVWYSQESRSYALLVLLVTASFLFFAQRRVVLWAIFSALALATHYFAAFVIVPEAVWLLWTSRRRAVLVAVAAVACVGGALLPLAIAQKATGHTSWIGDIPLSQRIKEVPKKFLIGEQGSPGKYGSLAETLKFVGVALAAAGAVLVFTRADLRERRGAIVAGSIGVAALVLPLVMKAAGLDYFAAYNLQAIWIPLAIAVAAGFGARRAGVLGLGAAGALCAVFLAVVIEVDANPTLERFDFKGAARALGRPSTTRAIVLSPQVGGPPLAAYLPGLRVLQLSGARVSEVDLVGMHSQDESTRDRPPHPPSPAFTESGRAVTDTYTIVRYRSRKPVMLGYRQLVPVALGAPPPAIVTQAP